MLATDLKEFIKQSHSEGIEQPILVEGSPGGGKTEIPGQVADELGIGCMVIHAPLLQPEDYGLPVVSKDKTNVDFVVSYDKFPLVGSECPDKGIFIIDELPQSDNSAQKILANLVDAREIHGKKLKKGWTIVATGNKQGDRSGANRILGHLGNRVCRIDLEITLDAWSQWALKNDVAPELIAFLRFRPDLLDNYKPNQDVNATPRSWVKGVSKRLGKISPKFEFEVFKGAVGEGPAVEFLAFLKVYRDLPSPDAIFLNPKKVAVPEAANTLYALCGALAYKSTPNNFGNALTYIRRLPAEFSVLFMRDAVGRNENLATTKTYIDWASKEGANLLT